MNGQEDDRIPNNDPDYTYYDLITNSFGMSNPQGLVSSMKKEIARMSEQYKAGAETIKPFSQVFNTNVFLLPLWITKTSTQGYTD